MPLTQSVVSPLLSLLPYFVAALAAPSAILLVVFLRKKEGRKSLGKAQPAEPPPIERKPFKPDYIRKEPMTPTERKFFARLVEALPDGVVAPQVAMSALVTIPAHQNKGNYAYANRSQFATQRVDFVVFDRESAEVVCVVELDDHTHDKAEAQESDRLRDAMLQEAGRHTLRFDARKMPTVEELRTQFGG